MYGEGAVSDCICQKWLERFRAGDFSLDDATPRGRQQHTQNIQVNKVIGGNEKCIFYFMEKTIQTFWPTQYLEIEHLYS